MTGVGKDSGSKDARRRARASADASPAGTLSDEELRPGPAEGTGLRRLATSLVLSILSLAFVPAPSLKTERHRLARRERPRR